MKQQQEDTKGDHTDGDIQLPLAVGERGYLNLLAVSVFVESIAFFMVPPILPAYSETFHFGQEDIALLLGLRSFAAILWAVPTGIFASRFGERSLLTAAFVLYAVSSLFLAFPQNWRMIAFACFAQGLGMVTIRTAAFLFVSHIFCSPRAGKGSEDVQLEKIGIDGEERSSEGGDGEGVANPTFRMNVVNAMNCERERERVSIKSIESSSKLSSFVGTLGVLYCWVSIGGFVGPVGGALLYEYAEPWIPFSITALLEAVMAAVVLFYPTPLRRSDRDEVKHSALETKPIDIVESSPNPIPIKVEHFEADRDGENRSDGSSSKPVFEIVRMLGLICRDPQAFGVIYIAFTQSVVWGVLEVVVPSFLSISCGAKTSIAGTAFGLNNLVYAVAAYFAGPIVNSIGSFGSIVTGILMVCTSLPALAIPTVSCSVILQYLLNSVNGVGFAFIETPLFPSLSKSMGQYSVRSLPLLLGLYQFVYLGGYALGPLIAAALLLATSYLGAMLAASILLSAGLAIVLWGRKGSSHLSPSVLPSPLPTSRAA